MVAVGREQLVGSSWDDVLTGGPNADIITGGGSQDEIDAMGGDDTIYALGGLKDIIDGGNDIDTATVDRSDSVVDVEVLT